MKKVIIWGAGGTGRRVYENIKTEYDVIGFVDMDSHKQNQNYKNVPIYSPQEVKNMEFDLVFLGTLMG